VVVQMNKQTQLRYNKVKKGAVWYIPKKKNSEKSKKEGEGERKGG